MSRIHEKKYCCDTEGVLDIMGSGSRGVPATPLMEVCSVIIQAGGIGDSDMQRSILVYGEIFVKDGKGKKYYFYNRPRTSPERVLFGKGLSLIDLNNAVLSMDAPDVVFALKMIMDNAKKDDVDVDAWCLDKKDGDDDPWFLNERVDMSTRNKNITTEQFESLTFNSALGTLTYFHYVVMPFAVAGQLAVEFRLNDESFPGKYSEADLLSVHGNIFARYGKSVSGLGTSDYARDFVLFKRVAKRAKNARFRKPVDLTRSMVCIPSYSSLLLDIDMAVIKLGSAENKLGSAENVHIKTVYELTKENFYYNSYKDRSGLLLSFQWHPDLFGYACYKLLKRPHKNMSASIIPPIPPKVSRADIAAVIFSVSVGLYSDAAVRVGKLEICGKVSLLDDTSLQRCIFHEYQNNPCVLSLPSSSLPLKGNLIMEGFRARFTTCITDAATGNEISHGYFNLPDLDTFPKEDMNRPLCAVIKGEHGYAAVHYGVFPSVTLAEVKFCVTPKNSIDELDVDGTLSARCAGFEFFLNHEQDYYRFVLFEGKGQCKPCEDYTLELSRSVLGVPSWSSLIFEVDFNIKGAKGSESVRESLEFYIGDTKPRKIEVGSYDIRLSVSFVRN